MGTAVFILQAIAIALSFLSGRGIIDGPAGLRIALGFCALIVIPGASIEALLFRGTASALERACRSFVCGLAFCSIVVCAGFIPGVSYPAIAALATLCALVLAFRARSKWVERRCMFWVAVFFALCVFAFWSTGDLGWRTDSLDHVSFVRRSLDSGALFPRDSFYREGDGVSLDPRKGLWHPVLSLWTYQSHAPADEVWRQAPAFIAFFAICSFLLLALALCGSRPRAALALAFFALFHAGEGIGWFAKLGFSKNIALIIFWIDCVLLFRYCQTRRREFLVSSFIAACIGAAYHIAFALLLGTTLIALFLYGALLPEGRSWRGGLCRIIPAQLFGIAIPLSIRAHGMSVPWNMIHTHLQGMLVFAPGLAVVDPAELVARYGVGLFYALALVPFFFLIAQRNERRGLVFMLFIVPAILVLDPLIASFMERRIGYLHYRILDAAPLSVMFALVVAGLCELLVFGSIALRRGEGAAGNLRRSVRSAASRCVAAVCIGLFAVLPLRAGLVRLKGAVRTLVENRRYGPSEYDPLFKVLEERLPGRSVIASDPLTSYLLSAYTDHFVTVTLDQHCSPADTNAMDRLREARNLLSPAVPLEASRPWLMRAQVDYVLLNGFFPAGGTFFDSVAPDAKEKTYEKFRACPSVMAEVPAARGFRLFRIRRDALEEPGEGACTVVHAEAIPCGDERSSGPTAGEDRNRLTVETGTDVGSGIVLESLTVDNYLLHPGDTLTGHVCWIASQNVPFGLPLEAVIRIDSDFQKGALYRDWYGKQYRRIVERWNDRFHRLTWHARLMSGCAYPDLWEARRAVKQDFSFALSPWLAPGSYEVRVMVRRLPYLANRNVSDYLLNDDSLNGMPVGMIYVQELLGGMDSNGAPEKIPTETDG